MDAAITPLELKQRLAAFPPPHARRRTPATGVPAGSAGDSGRDPAPARSGRRLVHRRRAVAPGRRLLRARARGEPGRVRGVADAWASMRAIWRAGSSWRAEGNATQPFAAPTRWVTRARPKIDRIACPWLIRRFIDPSAEFFYVPNAEVRTFAAANGATAYDIPDVDYSHVGPECSFDAFIRRHELGHPALDALAKIVRAADTSTLDRSPQAPGLLAASPRAVRDVCRRSRDAEVGNARLRLALRVVPRRANGNARLVSAQKLRAAESP